METIIETSQPNSDEMILDWRATSIGEFYCVSLAIYTIELNEADKRRLNTQLGIFIEDGTFNFHSADNTISFVLTWFEENKELWGAMVIYDPDMQKTTIYEGYEQLSHPEPSKFIACIFNKCFELITGCVFGGTTTIIEQGYQMPTAQEWDAARAKLFNE